MSSNEQMLQVARLQAKLSDAVSDAEELRAENDRIWAEVVRWKTATETAQAERRAAEAQVAAVRALADDAAWSDIGRVVLVEDLRAALSSSEPVSAREVTPPPEGTTCLCGEALRPGFGWHSCAAGYGVRIRERTALSSSEPVSDQCKTAKDTGSCDQCHDHLGRHKPCQVPDA